MPVVVDDLDKLKGVHAFASPEPRVQGLVLRGHADGPLDKLKGELALACPERESKAAFLDDMPMLLNGEYTDKCDDVPAPSPSKDSWALSALMSFLQEGWPHEQISISALMAKASARVDVLEISARGSKERNSRHFPGPGLHPTIVEKYKGGSCSYRSWCEGGCGWLA